MTTYLKVVSNDFHAALGGAFDFTPYLPTADGPGEPLPYREAVLCESGWHWCTPEALMQHWTVPNMQVYEAQPSDDVSPLSIDGKCVSSSGRLLRTYLLPQWWHDAMQFINEIPNTPFHTCQGEPNPEWKLFLANDWDAARDAAWDAAREAAREAARDATRTTARVTASKTTRDTTRNTAWDAAWDAALYVDVVHICADLNLDTNHVEHARARWDVWQRGYELLCAVDGVLYVYGLQK